MSYAMVCRECGTVHSQALLWLCDECNDFAEVTISLKHAGRVLIDGRDNGGRVDLCGKHRPQPPSSLELRDCVRVKFISLPSEVVV